MEKSYDILTAQQVINDDGPPDLVHSPYVNSLVQALQAAGHIVSVCLPHVQRSWIGKAHFIGQRMTPTYYRPGNGPLGEGGKTTELPAVGSSLNHSNTVNSVSSASPDEWVLVDGTPASCAQLGLHHLFKHRGPIDLVVSGPNFGRNSSALYALSSGTLGGALEAAACRVKAIGLSFAYERPRHDDPDVVMAACRHSVRIIEHLWDNWGEDVDLYSVNVPVRPDVEEGKVMVTFMLQNRWAEGQSCFKAVSTPGKAQGNVVEETDKVLDDKMAREGGGAESTNDKSSGYQHQHYEWAPSHGSVRQSADEASDGADAKVLLRGWTSVTPLKAALWEVAAHPIGEMRLSARPSKLAIRSDSKLVAYIDYEDAYVQPLILSALENHLTEGSWERLSEPLSITMIRGLSRKYLQISSYEALSHESLLLHPKHYLANSYTIRKALIRKHHLASTVASWRSKHPDDILASHIPLTLHLELDYAEFLDEALVEAYELHESWARNIDTTPEAREWWILKPGMSDRGQGIRLFSSEEELQKIFEQWEEPESEDEEDKEDDFEENVEREDSPFVLSASGDRPNEDHSAEQGIMTSQLRHFVVQPYISPLLLPTNTTHGNTKFHLRSYVLAVGALKVFAYNEPLALFAATPYVAPGKSKADPNLDLRAHLTNTCLQSTAESTSTATYNSGTIHDGPVALFSKLPLRKAEHEHILNTIYMCTASLFKAAAAQPTHFQPLPNAFELFGFDWLVDEHSEPSLLEVNAFPDFRQSGAVGHEVVEDVWNGAIGIMLGTQNLTVGVKDVQCGFVEVLDLDLGRT